MNPYAIIEATPLFAGDGMKSYGRSVRIMDDEGAWQEIGVVSSGYLLVHNQKVKDVVNAVAAQSKINDWQPRKEFFDGRRYVYAITSDNLVAEINPGDVIRFGLIGYNSYDGSRSLAVGAYAEHLVCSNGMTSESYFARFPFRHNQGNIDWDEQTGQAFKAVMGNSQQQLSAFASMLKRLGNKPLTVEDLETIRRSYLTDISPSIWGKIVDRYLLEETHSALGLLDACTRIFWHNTKQSISDYTHTSHSTDGMMAYAGGLNDQSVQS